MVNALTFDIEDYFHVNAFCDVINPDQWSHYEYRVPQNTKKILNILEETQCRATFFILGWVVERSPDLVREIASAGHEIASHGYSHKLVFNQTKINFKNETERSKKLLEDITGLEVRGYRASTYSITQKSLWALDVLVDLGFKYDSSIYPINHDVYGMPWAKRCIHELHTPKNKSIIEFPITTKKILGKNIPIGGGGYFRLFPYWFTKYCLKSEYENKESFIFYLHPWELDINQPRINNASKMSKFRHYNNIKKTEKKFYCLLKDFKFNTVEYVLRANGKII